MLNMYFSYSTAFPSLASFFPPRDHPTGAFDMPGPFTRLAEPLAFVRQFTPNWFAVTMGTGALALVIAALPWGGALERRLGEVFWLFNAVLFAGFALLFIARILMFRDTLRPMLLHLMAVALLRLGREPEARGAWGRALDQRPDFDLAQDNLDDLAKPIDEQHAPWPYSFADWLSSRAVADLGRGLPAARCRAVRAREILSAARP